MKRPDNSTKYHRTSVRTFPVTTQSSTALIALLSLLILIRI